MAEEVQAEPIAVVWFLAAAARRDGGRSIIVSHCFLDFGFFFSLLILLFLSSLLLFLFSVLLLLWFSRKELFGQNSQAMSLLILTRGSAILHR